MVAVQLRPHPGPVKVRAVPLVKRRRLDLLTVHQGPFRDIVDGADVVSEGRTEDDRGELWYYGFTSVVLPRGRLPDVDVGALAEILRRDPHVRLRVLRIAHREAAARAGGTLGTLRAEIDVAPSARGVALLVEVVARLARGQLHTTGVAER